MTKGHKGDSLPIRQGPSSDLLALYLGSVVTLVRHCIHFFKWEVKVVEGVLLKIENFGKKYWGIKNCS